MLAQNVHFRFLGFLSCNKWQKPKLRTFSNQTGYAVLHIDMEGSHVRLNQLVAKSAKVSS